MDNKFKKFFVISCIGLLTFLSALFLLIVVEMQRFSHRTTDYISETYMRGINEAIVKHYDTILSENIISLKSIGNYAYMNMGASKSENLNIVKSEALRAGFPYLAVIKENGEMEALLGETFEIENKDSFLEEIHAGEKSVRRATTKSGKLLYVVGIRTQYMNNEHKGRDTYLIAGKSTDYLVEQLSLREESNSVSFSTIFNREGRFVARSVKDSYVNIFEKMEDVVVESEMGKGSEYTDKLKKAIANSEELNTHIVSMAGRSIHLSYTPLPNSPWYLATGVHEGTMDEGLRDIFKDWMAIVLGGYTILVLILMFFYYTLYNLFVEQMEKLNRLQEQEKNANLAKTEFLANISHDIRTPMNTIVLSTRMAKEHTDDKEILNRSLDNILISGKHLLDLINGILDMTKFENDVATLKLEKVFLTELFKNISIVIGNQAKLKR